MHCANRQFLRLLLSGWVGGVGGFFVVGGGSVRADVLFVRGDVEAPGDGSSWSTAYDDLQAALAEARSGDEIWVAVGVYRPSQAENPDDLRTATFRLRQGVAVYGGFAGTETALTERAGRFEQTILSGDLDDNDELVEESAFDPYSPTRAENAYHVVTGSGTDGTAVLDGFTVTGGQADGEFPHDGGAGMLIDSGSPTVVNCVFRTNAADLGGGMWIHDGAPQITSCAFDRNAARASGGGVHHQSADSRLTACSFTDNSAGQGGGIASTDGSRLTLMTSTLERNTAVFGGAINSINVSELTAVRCTFEANSADRGGAIHTLAGNTTTLDSCTLVGNSAGAGGAIFNTFGSDATLTRCTLSDNSAGEGGAMLQEGGVATLKDCRIDGNVAEVKGGGVWALAARIDLFGCRVIDNSASRGGGILVDTGQSTVNACRFEGNGVTALRLISAVSTVTNCLFVRNGEAIGSSNHSFSTITNCTFFKNVVATGNSPTGHPTLSNCIVSDSLEEHFGGSSPGNTVATFSCIEGGWPGDGNVDGDPLFVLAPLDGDDRPENLRLGPGSPCIDAGDNTGVPADVTEDLVGNPRRLDDPATPDRGNGSGDQAIVDMGAFEFVLPGDWDYDYDADLADYLSLVRCIRRPGTPVGDACRSKDLDLDNDVDFADLVRFQAVFTGSR